ncbi:MAG: 4Fe-4S single cluster domain-containing protein [Clostridium sp.]
MPRISHYVKSTSVLGPGKRFAIWFQGCYKRCKGCINPQGQKLDLGYFISNEELINIIRKEEKNISGVTISGGEPFIQIEELYSLIKMIKEKTNLDIMVYSGYIYKDIVSKFSKYKEIFNMIDIFIDGDYVENLNNNSLYKGSDNQKIYFFTEKYKKYINKINSCKNRNIEFEIINDNEIFFIGIPPKNFYETFLEEIGGI